MLVSIFSVLVFFVFSDILSPIALSGPMMRFILGLNPFMILKELLSELLIFKTGQSATKTSLIVLTIIFVIMFIGTYFSKKISKRKILRQGLWAIFKNQRTLNTTRG